MAEETETEKVYDIHDGVLGRTGGPYLEEVVATQEENLRAFREGRAPTKEGAKQPHPGSQLVNAAQLVAAHNPVQGTGRGADASFDGNIEAPVRGERPAPDGTAIRTLSVVETPAPVDIPSDEKLATDDNPKKQEDYEELSLATLGGGNDSGPAGSRDKNSKDNK